MAHLGVGTILKEELSLAMHVVLASERAQASRCAGRPLIIQFAGAGKKTRLRLVSGQAD